MKSLLTFFSFPFFIFFLPKPLPVNDVPNQLLEALQQWHEENPQEKVYVQTDRDQYIAGESIWLKAWCTLGGKPSFLSRIVYVELVDGNGNVVDKKMYTLDNAAGTPGVIDLPKDLKSGNYSLNAYTLWMLNYPSYVLRKDIFIYNSDYKSGKAAAAPNVKMYFFPEGGDMVEGVKSRIAFKAIDQNGFAADVKGSILASNNTKVADVASEHDGMGAIELTPAANTQYRAEVSVKGKKYSFDLPAARNEGVALSVQNNNPNRLFVLVNLAETNKEKYNKLFLLAHINGVPVYQAAFNVAEGENGASISKKSLPAGIIHLTLFDSVGGPIAERIAFVANQKILSPAVTNLKTSTAKRGLNTFSFSLDSIKNADLTVAVTDASVDAKVGQAESLASSLLLTSDIKGYVHNPGYYFANKDEKTLQHLDLLLLTQGWRRFNWKRVKGEEKVTLKYPVESALSVKGKVTKSGRSEPLTTGTVSLIIKAEDSTTILSTANLTDKGEFIVDSVNFLRRATISLQGNNSKNSLPVDVTIYPAYIDTLKKSPYLSLVNADTADMNPYSAYVAQALEKLKASGKEYLENVTVKTKKVSRIDSIQREYVSPIYENSDQSIEVDENTGYSNIWQIMNAKINGFSVNPFAPGGVTSATFARNEGIVIPSAAEGGTDLNIQFFLNEIPVTADVIDAITPTDVALIKVYKGPLSAVIGADGGGIAVYTKKGVGAGKPYEKRFEKMKKLGFETTREFFNPDYTLNPDMNKDLEDTRITLYWNPKMKLSKDGLYNIRFHNNDQASKFKIIIQGLDSKGNLIYKEQIIQ